MNSKPSFGPLWHSGPTPGSFYNFPGNNIATSEFWYAATPTSNSSLFDNGTQRSSQPITTGTSVIGFKFNGGVLISADTLVSYGSMARYRDIDRVFKINDYTIIGGGGDYADFQFLKRYIDQKVNEDVCHDDNMVLKPKSLYNWLTRILYNKRSRFEPLWVDIVVGGIQDGEPFLGHIDMRGRSYVDTVIATGYGKHLALPLLREYSDKSKLAALDVSDALKLNEKCMEVLFYRDCRSSPQYKQAICTIDQGTRVEGPFNVQQNWKLASQVKGYN